MPAARRRLVIWIGISVAAALLLTVRVAGHLPRGRDDVARPVEILRDEYVSSKTCRPCHPGQYESWHGSYHRRMTQLATPETVAPVFDGVRLEIGSVEYALERRGDQHWVRVDPGLESFVEQRRVVVLTGSHHRQWFWFASGDGRKLGAMPFLYLIAEDQWIPREAGFMLSPGLDFTHSHHDGQWGASCVSCHTTHGQMTSPFGDEPRTVEFGISCEACHGPAERHVELNRRPRRRYGRYLSDEGDDSIVNPAKLDHRRSSEVCGQCHTVSLMASLSVQDEESFDTRHHYLPGENLTSLVGPIELPQRVTEATSWKDGLLRSGGREYDAMIATPCFEKGEISCLSCHLMHRTEDDPRPMKEWADDQLGPGMRSDQACLDCHKATLATKQHTFHEPDSSGSSCYNCHMPFTSYALLKAIRNHGVGGPTVQESVEAGRPNACNLCHLDKSLAWTAKYLDEWYEIPAPPLEPDQHEIAASVEWLLSGYAGQRGLVAWHMGWEPAQRISGAEWLAAYLAQLLSDPYPAVRIMAERSLRTLPGFEEFPYDPIDTEEALDEATLRAIEHWREQVRDAVEAGDPKLVAPSFALDTATFARLLRNRDPRLINWLE